MKKLIALATVLMAITMSSCQQQEAVDIEPTLAETPITLEINSGATETESEDDDTVEGGSGSGTGG